MKPSCFVGFDTSNYTTSIAVAELDGNVLANLKAPLPVSSGARGLRQSDAVFAHIKNLPELCDKLSEVLKDHTPIAVGVSTRPRSAEGSYMPCFLAGNVAAHSFAAESSLPIFEFSHQDGHIEAAYHSSGADITGDFAAFHVSGGTTEIVYVKRNGTGFSVEPVGGTDDLNAGQSIDRTGVMMGLSFPCGAAMDRLAMENKAKLPPVKISVKGLSCNLSGVENLAAKLWSETEDPRLVSAFVFEYIAKTIYKLTDGLRERYPDIPVIYAGGVMSSSYISARLARPGTYFAKPAFSADNAAGIALLCRKKYLSRKEQI